jgi:hypothetical protein
MKNRFFEPPHSRVKSTAWVMYRNALRHIKEPRVVEVVIDHRCGHTDAWVPVPDEARSDYDKLQEHVKMLGGDAENFAWNVRPQVS